MYNSDTQKLQNKIIQEVAKEVGLPTDVVFKVVRSQWDFLRQVITSDNPDTQLFSLKIRQLGIFGVKNFRFKISKKFEHLHVPVNKIVKNIDPRKQNTN